MARNPYVDSLSNVASEPALEVALNVVSVVVDIVVLYLLFTRPGSLWFHIRSR